MRFRVRLRVREIGPGNQGCGIRVRKLGLWNYGYEIRVRVLE